jgi:mannose-6-phosphate isomerase-like protein (cupin superfamily)
MISKFKPGTEFRTDERCSIVEMHNREDDAACSIVRARVSPGVTTQLHALDGIAERYVILDGEGVVEIGHGEPAAVRPMDVVFIPAGVSQRITNVGKADLLFLCVCTPRFQPHAYTNMSGERT